jgi:multidrug transporter EmrE-like cation transporter
MAWLLVLAELFEAGWAIGLAYSKGFKRLWSALGAVGT